MNLMQFAEEDEGGGGSGDDNDKMEIVEWIFESKNHKFESMTI